ncbi:putative tellurite resistance protein B-like protein [Hoeflea marina]|uniref:Putative tellurite resistance protein B-like protein n=1 Tax=Hoeflea marina TaxID=274592 RepID=A0A317PGK1_9HYPH|nr:TerB family tellurite resistance protein [Hoeflea marina]PWV98262.1 putative tellurite resistance protein B-like protein [Hoeflea marina]
MFETVRDFIKGLRGEDEARRPAADDPDVAAVALFFHVVGADGVIDAAESARLRSLIASDYGKSGSGITELLDAGREADRESVDLYAFTSVLKRHLDEAARIHFVELLWELAYADGARHELEEHVVWRIADLLGVDGRERVLARQRVAARVGTSLDGDDAADT